MSSLGQLSSDSGYQGSGSPNAEARLACLGGYKERTHSLCTEVSIYQSGPEGAAVYDEDYMMSLNNGHTHLFPFGLFSKYVAIITIFEPRSMTIQTGRIITRGL